MNWLFILTVAIVLIFGVFLWAGSHPAVTCPQCQSQDIAETHKEPTGMNVTNHGTGPGSGDISVHNHYIVTFQCQTCHHKWKTKLTETR